MSWLDSISFLGNGSGSGFGSYGYTPDPTAPPADTGSNTGNTQSGNFAETFSAITAGTSSVLNALSGLFSFGKQTSAGMPLPPDDSDDYSGGSGTGKWDVKKILITAGVVLALVAAGVAGVIFFKKKKKA